jgi:hypothetical protein
LVGKKAYIQTLQKFLDGFVYQALYSGFHKHKREDIRAMVVFGEAVPPAFTALGTMELNAVGTETV